MPRPMTLLFVAALLFNPALSAQAPPPPMGPGGFMGQGPCPPPMGAHGRTGPPALRFLGLSAAQEKAVQAIQEQHRAALSSRRRALGDKAAALGDAVEDPAVTEAQLRALQAAESDARMQAVLEERAVSLEINALLTAEQRAKARRLREKMAREREARMDLMQETGEPGPPPR